MTAEQTFKKLGYKFNVLGDYIIYKHEEGAKVWCLTFQSKPIMQMQAFIQRMSQWMN